MIVYENRLLFLNGEESSLYILRTIGRNIVVLLTGQTITVVLTYFYTIHTARYLGAESFGTLCFAIAFAGISCLLTDLGLNVLTTREVSRNNLLVGKYVGNILLIKIILTIITLGFTTIAITILGYPFKTVLVVYLITFSTIISSFTSLFNSIFQAFQKMKYISASVILNSILMFAGTVIAISQNLDIISFAIIYLLVSSIIFGYSLFICIWKFLLPKIELDLPFWKNLLKESLPFWMTSVFVIIYVRMDMIMLSMMKGDEVVGWYAASYRLIDGLSIIPGVFMSVMFPIFSRCYVDSKNLLELAFKRSLKFIILIAFPIGIGTTILSNEIIMLIYGNAYVPSGIVLKILIWAGVLSFINWIPATLLISTNRQKDLMIFTCIGAILNLVLNYLLIPSWSYSGAGISTVITELVVGSLMLYQIQKTQSFLAPFLDVILRSLISAIIMGIFILIFKNYTLFLLVPFSSILYFTVLFIVNGVNKDDLNILKSSMGR